jgi:hypothetical protein
MTTTGYINMVFTEINPTSTTTAITLVYNRLWDGASYYTIGPYTVLQHETPVTTPTPTAAPTTTQLSNPTVTVTVTSRISSSTHIKPSCEFLVGAFLLAVCWL